MINGIMNINRFQQNNINNNNHINFGGRKIAVTKPVIDGIEKEIAIYKINNKDWDFIRQITNKIDLAQLLPSKVNSKNFPIWQDIINLASNCVGDIKKASAYIAIHDKKPCGIIVTSKNRKQGCVNLFATWPIKIETKVKKAGSTLFTSFLDVARRKNLQKISLEPVINGPTDAVGFYKAHGLDFPDKKGSLMTMNKQKIKETLDIKTKELNFQKLENQPYVSIKSVVDFE